MMKYLTLQQNLLLKKKELSRQLCIDFLITHASYSNEVFRINEPTVYQRRKVRTPIR